MTLETRLLGPAVGLVSFALLAVAARGLRPSSARAAGAGEGRVATPGRAAGAASATTGAGAASATTGAGAAGGEVPRLDGAASSLPDLAARVVDGLGRGDRRALWALTLSRREYAGVLFPRLPVDHRAGAGFYFDNLAAGSLRDLGGALARLGGHALTLRSVAADPAQAERLGDLTVHRGVVMQLSVDGRPLESHLLGGVVEWRGAFKLTRYRADER